MNTTRQKYSKEFADSVMQMSGAPKIGQFYQHYNGNVYQVIAITDENPGYPSHVVHQGKNAKVWTRELDTWYQSMMRIDLTDAELAEFVINVEVAKAETALYDDFERREAAFRKELVDLCNTYKIRLEAGCRGTVILDNNQAYCTNFNLDDLEEALG